MAESGRRKVSRMTKDIVSELRGHTWRYPRFPANARWRHSWKTIPHLNFDDQFPGRMKDKQTQYHDPEFKMYEQLSLAGFENRGLEYLTEFSCGLCFGLVRPSKTSNMVKVLCSLHKIEKIYIAVEFIQKRMAESGTRQVRRIKKDRISVLPQNVQETILCFLPIRDAVRTSILSTKWRDCWTMVPHLVFDEDILRRKFYDDSEVGNALEFVSVVNKVLLLHNGPILTLSICFPQAPCNYQIIHNFIDQWIPLFSRKGIKQLTVDKFYPDEFVAHNFYSLKLTHLRLVDSWFPYTPAFGGLTYMRNLELVDVTTFGQSIFDCPVLEKLTLLASEGLSHTNFRAPNLKCLHQHYREMMLEYSLAGLENLTEYSFTLSGDPITQVKTFNVVNALSTLHNIEKFSIAKYFIKYLAAGGSPNRLSKPLLSLKTLSISDINLTHFSEVSCLLCLMRSAPNLCNLHISADPDPYDEEENLEDYYEEKFEDCTVDHLEIVTFSHFQGLKAELELVKFLLAHSPLLKTMFIHRDFDMEKDVAFKIAEEMLVFSRASSRAQIKHLEDPYDAVDFGPWANQFRLLDYY